MKHLYAFIVVSLFVSSVYVLVEVAYPVVLKMQYAKLSRPAIRSRVNVSRGSIDNIMTTQFPKKTLHCLKRILVWEQMNPNLKRPMNKYTCPNSPCTVEASYTGHNVNMIPNKDAVVIEYWSRKNFVVMLSKKTKGQKWLIATRESPYGHHIMPPPTFQSVYDWIMTYRYGSNISIDWGYYDKGNPDVPVRNNIAKDKTKLISWVSSHCGTAWPRRDFVLELNKYINVEMFGHCGNKTFPCKKFSAECGKHFKKYKFYLALENSQCRDYITEKFWSNAMSNDVVPVVVGPPREDYERVAPPNSFIYAEDFKSVADLAEYLKLLDSNDTLYNEYFKWKKEGRVIATSALWRYDAKATMCHIADKLLQVELNPALESPPISLSLSGSWWKGSCKQGYKELKMV